MPPNGRLVQILNFVGLLLLTVGCANDENKIKPPPLGAVTGKVTLDGEPLENALVEFVPAHARASSGTTDASGIYTLDFDQSKKGAAVGEHTVRIVTKVAAGEGEESVPAKYNVNSELRATVEEGDNTLDFDLKSN